MKKLLLHSLIFLLLVSCNEELISKPNNLIPEDKMADIIQEMFIVNAAKTTNSAVFHENNIDPTSYVLEKFEVDSLQYVESDQYYVSKPLIYEKIFKTVEKRLEANAKEMSALKNKNDSIRKEEQKEDAKLLKKRNRINKDSPR